MTRTRYGMIAGIAGALAAAWWWRHRTDAVARGMAEAGQRGETIFSNAPVINP
jgi:hypothetical protein